MTLDYTKKRQPRLNQKTAVVTGGSSGIGRAIAIAYANEGANVIVNYCQSADRAEQVVNEITEAGGRAIARQGDMANVDDIQRLIKSAEEVFGAVDVWVNNAGADILTGLGAGQSQHEKLHRLIDVDLKGTINACWAVAPAMQARGSGAIINMSWDLAIHGFEGTNPQLFAATKAGVLGFSRSLALSYAPHVRVNVLAPGWIMTAFAEQNMDQEYHQARTSEIPLGRFGTPADVAHVAVYLGSDDSAYITGEMIKINGGLI